MEERTGIIVQSVSRAAEILRCFTYNFAELGISQIAEMVQLNKSTVYGLVNTLVSEGMLEQSEGSKKYRLGIKLFELGCIVQKRMDLSAEARPFLEKLSDKYHKTVHLAIPSEGQVVYVEKISYIGSMVDYSGIGKRGPMYCTGVGKAVMAYMPVTELERHVFSHPLEAKTPHTITDREKLLEELSHIRKVGYACDNEEIELGLHCIAAPIFGFEGKPLGAISLSYPNGSISSETISNVIRDVRNSAREISSRMGYSSL